MGKVATETDLAAYNEKIQKAIGTQVPHFLSEYGLHMEGEHLPCVTCVYRGCDVCKCPPYKNTYVLFIASTRDV